MPLPLHQSGTFQTELYARIGVDGVVDAAVAGNEAAQHTTVRRVDNSVGGKGSNIAPPEIQAGLYRRQILKSCDAPFDKAFRQIGVLHAQKFCADR